MSLDASIFPQWAADINTAFSFVGFLITGYVMVEVRFIRQSFRSKARLPEIITELERVGSTLNALLANWSSGRNDALLTIKNAAVLLKTAAALLPRSERAEPMRIHRRLREAARLFHQPQFLGHDSGWDIYSDIQSSITSLNQVRRNLNWE
jgi:hypothetical protein